MTTSVTNDARNYQERVIPFNAGDGFPLNLINVRHASEAPTKGPVLLVHGAGVRANIFRAPVETNIVDALVAEGYDVWLENWRASIDFPENEWTLDQAALYDHPYAVKKIIAETGVESIKAIIHCQGSTSFMMSAVAGLVPEVNVIVSNAVSLHPIVPSWSAFKLNWMLPMVAAMTKYLNPHWGIEAPTVPAKLISALISLTHHECDKPVCKQVSFTYGSGFPALWSHENLNEATHGDWLVHEFAAVPLTFFKQITRCVRAGHLLSVQNFPDLPTSFVAQAPKTKARLAFFAGADNLCFLPDSQIKTHAYFDGLQSNYHSLHVLPNYGHLDVFIGQHAERDTFPLILAELDKN